MVRSVSTHSQGGCTSLLDSGVLGALLSPPLPTPPGLPEGDGAAGPAGNAAPGGGTEDPAPAKLVPDGAGTPALLTDEAGGHHHPGIKWAQGPGVGAAMAMHIWPLNVCCALSPAGGPTAFVGLWRGHRQPCTFRPHGGATGIGRPTGARDRASSACRASAGGTCSARGE